MLSLRENRLTDFPLPIVNLVALTYCDLGYNRLTCLPSALLSANPVELATLIVEGNPLSSPPFDYLSTACQDVTSFAQIDACLRQYYQVQQEFSNGKIVEKPVKSKQQSDLSLRPTLAGETMSAVAGRSKGDEDDSDDALYNVSRVPLDRMSNTCLSGTERSR